ncbi:MAG TPA: hypothetical protein VFV92_12875 [Candidatus Bathyarchaeia archaeon]|nr:hypothetical protein [Candidatus Bathyarchaeia archaeon]
MRSIGPFLLTDEEFSGLRFRMEEDQQLRALKNQAGPSLVSGLDCGTGESGEAADVEAQWETVEIPPRSPLDVVGRVFAETLSARR